MFLYPVINQIKNDIMEKRNNSRYIDGKYYLSEIKNNLPNGTGIKY